MRRITQHQIDAVRRRLTASTGCDHDNRVNVAILDEGDELPPACPRCGEVPPVLVVSEEIVHARGDLLCAT